MRLPFSPIRLVLFTSTLLMLFVLVQLGLLHITAEKLGVNPTTVLLALFFSLTSSIINFPLFKLRSTNESPVEGFQGVHNTFPQYKRGYTIVAINLGGAILPVVFSIFLFFYHQPTLWHVLTVTTVVATVSYRLSKPIPGLGIAMPLFIPPLIAALIALLISPSHSAPVAYIGGTFGVILGADILKLNSIRMMGAPIVSIGGAGTFDGIFLTGIIAVLLA